MPTGAQYCDDAQLSFMNHDLLKLHQYLVTQILTSSINDLLLYTTKIK